MAESPERPQSQSQQQTPQKPSHQNGGVRTNGRAFNSPNWRLKSEESPSRPTQDQQGQNGDSPRRSGLGLGRMGQNREREVPQAISEGRRLYVGNMPYTAKMEDVKELFKRGGFEVARIDIAIDPFSGRNPSYCFVDLETKELAERAMTELDGADLAGRPVKIKPGIVKSVSERQQQQQQRTMDGSAQGSSSPRANGMNGNRSSPFNADRWRRDENAPPSTPSKSSSTTTNGTGSSISNANTDPSKRLYVGGLPRLTEQDKISAKVTDFFKGYNVSNVSKLFTPHPAKRFEPGDHYYLFVDFESVEETQNAMAALNGAEGPWGAPIRVQRARGENYSSEERRGRWGSSRQEMPSTEGEAVQA
ncbi:hypothetical protein BDV06DRAFT_197365 [Aspergillus oleicola]